jgi:carboxymethylenebutenolidase
MSETEEHHHAHGPANRGRVVLTTAAPLFVCEPASSEPKAAVIALHGRHGITAQFERSLRAVAARGYLVAAPFHYFRDGGPEYVTESSASTAYAALAEDDIDADVDAAVDHIATRLRLRTVAAIGAAAVTAAVRRAGARHPELIAVSLPETAESSSTADDGTLAGWISAVEHLRRAQVRQTGV